MFTPFKFKRRYPSKLNSYLKNFMISQTNNIELHILKEFIPNMEILSF